MLAFRHLPLQDLCRALADGLTPTDPRISACANEAIAPQECREVEELMCSVLARLQPDVAGNEEGAVTVVKELVRADVLRRIPACLETVEFDARKDAMRVFDEVLRLSVAFDIEEVVEYISGQPDIMLNLAGAAKSEIFFHAAHMLRSCIRSPALVAHAFETGVVLRVIDLVLHQDFDVSAEAFSVLRGLLLAHKEVSAPYLMEHFGKFFEGFHTLLQVECYVVQRQALRLLGEMLLDGNFTDIMLDYVQDSFFLQIHMKLLRNDSKAIRKAAFHVFKIFVANPEKRLPVSRILIRNRDRLIDCLNRKFPLHEDADDYLVQDLCVVAENLRALQLVNNVYR
jgi:calcium binding protein 39